MIFYTRSPMEKKYVVFGEKYVSFIPPEKIEEIESDRDRNKERER